MNRSSLLVPDQVTKPQEVNGTNGKAAAVAVVAAAVPTPAAEPVAKGSDHSTDSEQDEAGDTDEPGTSKSHCTCCCSARGSNQQLNNTYWM